MKIVMFTGYYIPHTGGIERYVDKLTEELIRRNHEVIIVTFDYMFSEKYEERINDKLHIYRLPVFRIFSGRYPIPKLNKTFRIIRKKIINEEGNFFILNTRFHLTTLIGAFMAKRQQKKAIYIEHGSAHLTLDNTFLDFLIKIYEHGITWFLRWFRFDSYGVSGAASEWLRHFHVTSSGELRNAISRTDSVAKVALREEKDELTIFFMGRLIEQKGLRNLIVAYKKVITKVDKKVRLVIAGDGPLQDYCEAEAEGFSIDVLGRVDFQGVKDNLQKADIFAFPSLHPEGAPTAVMEAGMFGCAVIATPYGGTKEIVEDKVNALVIDGSTESITEALMILIDDDKLRNELGEALRQKVLDNFTWEKTADALERVMSE